VDVSASLSNSVSLSSFTQPLLDTPQTVAVIPQFVLKEQAEHDAARCSPQCARHQHGSR